MEILDFKTGNINTKNKKLAWAFLRDDHMKNILLNHNILNDMLDEYLFLTIKECAKIYKILEKSYWNRMIDNIVLEEITFEQNKFITKLEANLKKYRSEHLVCFKKLLYGIEVSNANIIEMVKFYDTLLKKVDKAIGKKYTYGYKFTENDNAVINEMIDCEEYVFWCPQNRITIFVPKKSFDKKAFHKNTTKKFKSKIKYDHYKKFLIIDYYNCKGNFDWDNLWQIRDCHDGPLQCYLIPDALTDNKIVLIFDN